MNASKRVNRPGPQVLDGSSHPNVCVNETWPIRSMPLLDAAESIGATVEIAWRGTIYSAVVVVCGLDCDGFPSSLACLLNSSELFDLKTQVVSAITESTSV